MNTSHEKLNLANGVFFNKVGDVVFVRNVKTTTEYLFNPIVYDILLAVKDEVTFDKIIEILERLYRIADREKFISEIRDFVEDLIEKGLVHAGKSSQKLVDPFKNITDTVQRACYAERRLWDVCLELTYRCNEKCTHCYLDDSSEKCSERELTLEEYKKLIDDLYELGTMNVLVTGGEPTLRPDFVEICEYLSSKGMLVDVFSNALNISTEVFDRLIALNVNSVSCTLFSDKPTFHDGITKVPGSFEKTLKNILMFKSAGVPVFIKSVVFDGHYDEYEGLRMLGKRLNITIRPGTIIIPSHSGKNLGGMMLSKEEDCRKLFRLERQDEELPIARDYDKSKLRRELDAPICSAGQTGVSINPFGKVYPCNTLRFLVGDIRKESIADIWKGSARLRKIQSMRFGDFTPQCANCQYSAACTICLGSCYDEKTDTFSKPPYVCNYAKLRFEEAF